jgi:hypothetical protein
MNQSPTRVTYQIIGIIATCFVVAMPAISHGASGLKCPAGYWPDGSLCLNNTQDDFSYASAPKTSQLGSEIGCAPGYWRYGALCLIPETGGMELADEQLHPHGQRAQAKGQRVESIDINALTAESDFTVFMAENMAEEVRRAALRKLWTFLQLPVSCHDLCYEPEPAVSGFAEMASEQRALPVR